MIFQFLALGAGARTESPARAFNRSGRILEVLSIRKYSCSAPAVVNNRLGLRPEQLEDAESLLGKRWIERSSGVFLSELRRSSYRSH
jgi:hypothetical protein